MIKAGRQHLEGSLRGQLKRVLELLDVIIHDHEMLHFVQREEGGEGRLVALCEEKGNGKWRLDEGRYPGFREMEEVYGKLLGEEDNGDKQTAEEEQEAKN